MKSLRAKILVAVALVCSVGLAIYIASPSADETVPVDSGNAGDKRSVRNQHGREDNSTGDSGDKVKDDTSAEDADPDAKRNVDLLDHYTALEELKDFAAIMKALLAMTKEPPDREAIEFLASRLGNEAWIARLREVKSINPFTGVREKRNGNILLYAMIEQLAISGGPAARRALMAYVERNPFHNSPPDGGRSYAIGTLGLTAGAENDPEAMALLKRLATSREELGPPPPLPAGLVVEDGVPLPEEWVKKLTKVYDRHSAIMALGTIGVDESNRILEEIALGGKYTTQEILLVTEAMGQAHSSSNMALLRKIILATEDENVRAGASMVLSKQMARLVRREKPDEYGFVIQREKMYADRHRVLFTGDPEAEALKILDTYKQLHRRAQRPSDKEVWRWAVIGAENSLKKIRANAAKEAAGN